MFIMNNFQRDLKNEDGTEETIVIIQWILTIWYFVIN